MEEKIRAKQNRTLTLNQDEIDFFKTRLLLEKNISSDTDLKNKTINGDTLKILPLLPDSFADLIIID